MWQAKSVSWSAVFPWIVRVVLMLASWRGIGSESGVVSGLAMFMFVVVLLSSVESVGRKQPVEAVLHEGDTRIVLQEGTTRRDWDDVVRVLHDNLNIDYLDAVDMFGTLPVVLEPAVIRSQAEDIVGKINKTGAVASLVTIDHEQSPE